MSPRSTGPRFVGGQALIEGVMMRAPHAIAAVVRKRNGDLVVREQPIKVATSGPLSWPLIRGIFGLVQALRIGGKALRFSAEVYEGDQTVAPAQALLVNSLLGPVKLATLAAEDDVFYDPDKPGSGEKRIASLISATLALTLFVALPQLFAAFMVWLLPGDFALTSIAFHALTGIGMLLTVMSYMLLIRRVHEIKRVFEYHGAEHKTVYAYEAGLPLKIAAARAQTRLHPRCGTTFVVMVAIMCIPGFWLWAQALPVAPTGWFAAQATLFAWKLPFLPVLIAVTFELQRLLSRLNNTPLRVLLWPGYLVQRITTIDPSDDQLEVAITALDITLRRETEWMAREQLAKSGPG